MTAWMCADERRRSESAEEDRSLQRGSVQADDDGGGGLSQIRVWLCARYKRNTNEKEPCDQVIF